MRTPNSALHTTALAGIALAAGCVVSGGIVSGCGWEPNTTIDPPGAVSAPPPVATSAAAEAQGASVHAARAALFADASKRHESARTSLHEDELDWIATPHDARTAFLVSPESGFVPWGLETSLSEIPVGWHTGRQRQGEQAIYIVRGSGFAVVDGAGYAFDDGTTLGLPYGSERQLFNTGDAPVRYFSATAFPLEQHLGLHRLEQLDVAGPNAALPEAPISEDGFDAQGRRIRLFWEEARYRDGSVGLRAQIEARVRGGIDLAERSDDASPAEHGHAAGVASRLSHHDAWVRLMGDGGQMGFDNRLVLISGFLIDEPGTRSGSHAHQEAVIYVVQGEGHSLIDGVKVPWRAGTSLHVQGPQTVHQHFSTGSEPAFLLRIASGMRDLMEQATSDVFPRLWFEARGNADEAP